MLSECEHEMAKVSHFGDAPELYCKKCHLSERMINKQKEELALITAGMGKERSILGKMKIVGGNIVGSKYPAGRVNWILFNGKGILHNYSFSSGCYGSIGQKNKKTRYMWDFSWGGYWPSYTQDGKKIKTKTRKKVTEESKLYATWVLNESPWKDLFLRKTFDEVLNTGSLVDGSKGTLEFVVQGCMALRNTHDYENQIKTWCHLVDIGVKPMVALLLMGSMQYSNGYLAWSIYPHTTGLWNSHQICKRAAERMINHDLSIMKAKAPISKVHKSYRNLIGSWISESDMMVQERDGKQPEDLHNLSFAYPLALPNPPLGSKRENWHHALLKTDKEILSIIKAWSDKNGGLSI